MYCPSSSGAARHFRTTNVEIRAAQSGRGYIDQREAFLARRDGNGTAA
jgi:hypothetical protein